MPEGPEGLPEEPEGLPDRPGGLSEGRKGLPEEPEGLPGSVEGGRMDIQMGKQMEFLPILHDFVPCQGRGPKSEKDG